MSITCLKIFANAKTLPTFAPNKTRHASRRISAPGRVFDFYGVSVSYQNKGGNL